MKLILLFPKKIMEDSAAKAIKSLKKANKANQEQINLQLQLINSLRTRIEELETDSTAKNEDIKKLRKESNDLRRMIQSICNGNINEPSGKRFHFVYDKLLNAKC